VLRATLSAPVFTIVGIAYLVDLFLRWGPAHGARFGRREGRVGPSA
jgi:hypothetical protein